jgi:hypothetical protein
MCSPRARLVDVAFEDGSSKEAPSNMPPLANKSGCNCNCGCICCVNDTNDKAETSPVQTPIRGRSLTPKYDRTNGAGNPVEARPTPVGIDTSSYNTASSVNGQEGLSMHQIERSTPTATDDTAAHANDSIERWMDEHHIPESPYRFPGSADPSMLVEASTAAPSSASSGFLPPRTATSDELTTFTFGGFDEPKAQTCAFTPLWLTHELRYCRNFQRGNAAEIGSRYPVTIDVDDLLE